MSFTDIYSLNIAAPITVTREDYNKVGSASVSLGSIPRSFTASSFELWDSKTGGSQLTLGADYNLTGLSSYYTNLAGEAINLSFQIINPVYETGSLFATYDTIGSLTSSEFYEAMQENGAKNIIINPNMEVAQRGTSFVSPANNTTTLDRWSYINVGTGTHTVTQDTDVPNNQSKHSLKIDCTATDLSIAAADQVRLDYRIEGYDYFPLVGKTTNLSFWVKNTKVGIYCVGFYNAVDRSYVAEYTVNESDTWEYKTITVPLDYTGGTWNFTNGIGIYISFTLMSGTTYQTTADTWFSGSLRFATSNQVNFNDSTANNFLVTQVQLTEGEIALPFQSRLYEEELALCQRYFEKSWDIGTAVAASTNVGTSSQIYPVASTGSMSVMTYFKVRKRATPTVGMWDTSGNGGVSLPKVYKGGVNKTGAIDNESEINFLGSTSNATSATQIYYHWTADAEL